MRHGIGASSVLLLFFTACGTDPAPAPVESTPTECNGSAALCDRAYNEVVYASTHNAMSNEDEGWVAPNQIHGLEQQLADGITAFMLDVHDEDGIPTLCHGYCALGSRDLVEALGAFKAHMDAHPGDVLTFLIEDSVPDAMVLQAITDAGLDDYLYDHPGGQDWPTLGAMVAEGKQLILFAENGGGKSGTYLHMWDFVFDSGYGHETTEAMMTDCGMNRGSVDSGLYLLNHWLYDVPTPDAAEPVNYKPFLTDRIEHCRTSYRKPNYIAVNYYDRSDLLAVVDALNAEP